MTYEEILALRKAYLPGTRIQKDLPNASEGEFEKGTVEFVDEKGQLHVRMDSGEDAVLTPCTDDFKKLNIDEQIQEADAIKEAQIADKRRKRDRGNRQDQEQDYNNKERY